MCLPDHRSGEAEAASRRAAECRPPSCAIPQADAGVETAGLAADIALMNVINLNSTERETALVRFLWDVEENVIEMEKALASMIQDGAKLDLIEQLYYQAYRIREGALTAGLQEVSELARVMENVFEHARNGQVEMTSYLIALLQPGCEALRRLTSESVNGRGDAEEREALGEGEGEEAPESDATVAAV